MSQVLEALEVSELQLWKLLVSRGNGGLASNVKSLCDEAVERMKSAYAYFPQYTLHDERHLFRTAELMFRILGPESDKLNDLEIALLLLAAFFHDQGMVLSREEASGLDTNDDFKMFHDDWVVDHPNYKETRKQLSSSFLSELQLEKYRNSLYELESAIITEYIRITHGKRVAEFMKQTYGHDMRLEVKRVNVSSHLAMLCESHTLPCDKFGFDAGLRYDEQVGTYTVNFPFLIVVLRLADILDFDRDRTPEVLYKSIHFTSSVSLCEWEKHRSVEGWIIDSKNIRFSIKCEHPAYEAAAREYMDWIDAELEFSRCICCNQPQNICGYKLNLPLKVDRSRIGPKDDLYKFHDLEFSLSRDEIVKLLMTDNLYSNKGLCVRELLQNSLDALRYRSALFLLGGVSWNDGVVCFRHYLDSDGCGVLECKDNGIGMDEDVIRKHFIKIGRSFYRSPSFERERNRLRGAGYDFDPCSQFGIGFMSCFMLGDRITIKTRKDYGVGRQWGDPLVIDIYGLSGLLVIKKGCESQAIGTSVEIKIKENSTFIDKWTDNVRLCAVLKGYALSPGFPVTGSCEVPGIIEEVALQPCYDAVPTRIEQLNIVDFVGIEQNLESVSANLSGVVRESFLVDADGLPSIKNAEAEWVGKGNGTRKWWRLDRLGLCCDSDIADMVGWRDVQICLDGILVAGEPGRPAWQKEVGMFLGHTSSVVNSRIPAFVDVRGDLKPEITPSRIPPQHMSPFRITPKWSRLIDSFKHGVGLLWEKLASYIQIGLSQEIFWKLTIVHGVDISWMPNHILWESISVMVVDANKKSRWVFIKDLLEMEMFYNEEGAFSLRDTDGNVVGPDEDMCAWERLGEDHPSLHWQMNMIVLLMSCLEVSGSKLVTKPRQCSEPVATLRRFIVNRNSPARCAAIDYVGDASNALTVSSPYPTINRQHPLVGVLLSSDFITEPNELQIFAKSFVPCISEMVSTKPKSSSLDTPGYWQKRISHFYFSVRWSEYDQIYKPPYRIWTNESGWQLFTEKDFIAWRDAPVVES